MVDLDINQNLKIMDSHFIIFCFRPRGGGRGGPGGGGSDPRGIVEYRDLDALKEETDTFFVMDES